VNALAQVAAFAAGLVHVMIFVLESVLFRRPAAHRTFGVAPDDVAAVQPWAFNQGFYNLFLAAGALGGLALIWSGAKAEGRTLVIFACASMLAAAVVLLATNRRMLRGALIQGLLPLVAVIAAVASR
jgi:putative membrane protein